jgi:23S rRNA (adenine2030-N6)-methyltransferase
LLSYRHAFHAGNHADVLKHLVLVCVLDHLLHKADKPFVFLDSHAGPGGCDLREAMATKNAEFEAGIGRIWDMDQPPEPLARYLDVVRGFNPQGALAYYPGSPAIARQIMTCGRLELCELHPDDHRRLAEWAGRDRRIHVHREDGFAQLKALLPPVERRALVLIDPPYEIKDDYLTVVDALRGALARFATGVCIAWYPLLARAEARALPRSLEKLTDRWLRVELAVAQPAAKGMHGSGVFVINPPWQLQAQLDTCRTALEESLCACGAKGVNVSVGPGVT